VRNLVWSSVRNNSGRYIATFVAIITGVAFFTATGLIGARVTSSLEGDVDRQYGNVDLAIVLEESDGGGLSVNPGRALTISAKSADRITKLPGVSGSAGELTAPVAFAGPNGKPVGQATGRLWITDDQLNPIDVTEGRAPARTGEIAIDQGTADARGLEVGERTTLLTLAGAKPVTVVGITSFGDNDALDQSGTVSLPQDAAVAWLNRGQREYQSLYLRGASQDQLLREVKPLVPAGFRAQKGDAFLAAQQDSIGAIGRALKNALQAFALLALLVGAFVIYNTFSVIVAQRLRELAVLAAIGATPRQIKRSLRLEGLVVGLIGSALGVAVGALLVALGLAVAGALGASLPGSGFVFPPSVAVQGILLGTIITLLSVMVPARRAARTEPIEALRVSAVDQTHFTKKRKVISAGLCLLGAGLMLLGGSAALVGLGALLLFIGVIVSGPFIALGGSRLLRPLMSRFGLEGRLAVDNTSRSPQRTATTANALLIGVFLVTLVTVSGTSVKDFAVQEINKLSSADYVITSDGGSVDPVFVRKVTAIDGITKVIPFRREAVTIDGKPTRFSTGDLAALQEAADIKVAKGSLTELGPGTIALVEGGKAKQQLGSTVTVSTNEGATRKLRVVALLDSTIDSSQLGALIDESTFDGYVGATAPTVAFVDAKEGEQTDTKKAINELADARPDITVVEGNVLGRLIGTVFDFMIKAVDGLLMMSVVVALIGIINTLSLSILERRRELGLLRVVGMTDNRVQRMVRLESLVIAGLGTIVGLVLGLFVAWAMVLSIERLTDADISPGLPVGTLALILVLGVALGLIASFVPSRRSTRLDVLEALEAT
jgi:putative ABC transport system permease protein